MKVAEAVRWVRRFLRDPSGAIWSDDLILSSLTQAQDELQAEVGAMVEVRALSIPPQSDYSYMFEWENEYLPEGRTRFQALRSQGGYMVFTGLFEVQSFFVNDSTDNTNDTGTGWTHPWEAYVATPNEPPLWQLPDDFCEMKMCYYDERPIFSSTRAQVMKGDATYKQREGEPQAWYMNDTVTRQFSVYPKPSTAVNANSTGSGMTTSSEDDTTSSEIGAISRITGKYTSSSTGVTIDTINAKDQLLLVYEISPREITSEADDFVWPDFMVKYVCYNVLSRLYGMNCDGRIPTLSRYWFERYRLGLEALSGYTANKRRNRLLMFSGAKSRRGRRKRLPRLPDKYPAVSP